MGADLYIKVIHDPLVKKYEPLFEKALRRCETSPPNSKEHKAALKELEKHHDLMHNECYFRDSYNATSILDKLGLSWWADVIPMLKENGQLEGAKLTLPTRKQLKERFIRVNRTGEDSLEKWHRYFIKKHKALIAFLDKAIELKTAIDCSL